MYTAAFTVDAYQDILPAATNPDDLSRVRRWSRLPGDAVTNPNNQRPILIGSMGQQFNKRSSLLLPPPVWLYARRYLVMLRPGHSTGRVSVGTLSVVAGFLMTSFKLEMVGVSLWGASIMGVAVISADKYRKSVIFGDCTAKFRQNRTTHEQGAWHF